MIDGISSVNPTLNLTMQNLAASFKILLILIAKNARGYYMQMVKNAQA